MKLTFFQAVEWGYMHQQGKYKGAPWIALNKQFKTSKEALAALNEYYANEGKQHIAEN
jgi:hypothetical protein